MNRFAGIRMTQIKFLSWAFLQIIYRKTEEFEKSTISWIVSIMVFFTMVSAFCNFCNKSIQLQTLLAESSSHYQCFNCSQKLSTILVTKWISWISVQQGMPRQNIWTRIDLWKLKRLNAKNFFPIVKNWRIDTKYKGNCLLRTTWFHLNWWGRSFRISKSSLRIR